MFFYNLLNIVGVKGKKGCPEIRQKSNRSEPKKIRQKMCGSVYDLFFCFKQFFRPFGLQN